MTVTTSFNPGAAIAARSAFTNHPSSDQRQSETRSIQLSRQETVSVTLSNTEVKAEAAVPAEGSPEETAGTILSFIESRLKRVQSEGGDRKELKQVLQEGYRGFKQGFREARETIRDVGKSLNDPALQQTLKQGLRETRQRVQAGIRELKETYLRGGPEKQRDTVESAQQTSAILVSRVEVSARTTVSGATQERQAPDAVSSITSQPAPPQPAAPQPAAPQPATPQPATPESATSRSSVSDTNTRLFDLEDGPARLGRADTYRVDARESFSLNITTLDGDVVTATFQSYLEQTRNADGVTDISSNNLSVSVSGNLDEGELEALKNLIDDIRSLAAEFYNGDLDDVMEMAGELSFDAGELSSMDLNLRQSIGISAYQQVAAIDSSSSETFELPTTSNRPSAQLFLEDLQDILETAQQFSEPMDLVSTLFEQFGLTDLSGRLQFLRMAE